MIISWYMFLQRVVPTIFHGDCSPQFVTLFHYLHYVIYDFYWILHWMIIGYHILKEPLITGNCYKVVSLLVFCKQSIFCTCLMVDFVYMNFCLVSQFPFGIIKLNHHKTIEVLIEFITALNE